MASPRHSTTIENLPCDVLSDIFIRFLAKQLAQMRCICKSWNALLSHSSFVKSHLHHSFNNNDGILFLFHEGFLLQKSSITARPTRFLEIKRPNFIKPPVMNPKIKKRHGSVIGSVNGQICFVYVSYSLPTFDYAVFIWNPSLSAMVTLPPCSFPSAEGKNDYRFGYDPKTDDYKIVRLTKLYEPYFYEPFKMLPEVEVYSMRKGSWEVITQSFPSHIKLITDGDYVCADGHDGHLHWLGSTGLGCNPDTIVAFDLGEEKLREIPLPDSILHHDRYRYRYCVLGVLGGKLCVMSRAEGCKWEVWVMDEYGVADSWVKDHVFSMSTWDIYPYGFASRSEFLFKVYGGFALYDPVAATTQTFKITDGSGISKIVEYVDSLVWVAPSKHELSKGHLSISISKSHQLLRGLQKAIKGVSRFVFSAVKRATKGKKSGSNSSILCYYRSA